MNSDAVKMNEKRFFDYVSKRDTIAMEKWIDQYVAEDFTNQSPLFDVPPNREGLKEMFYKLFQLFPDMTITIEEMVFENDILSFRHMIQENKNSDALMGMAMVKLRDGKIVDRWATTSSI
jgi:predicted ester cyclase